MKDGNDGLARLDLTCERMRIPFAFLAFLLFAGEGVHERARKNFAPPAQQLYRTSRHIMAAARTMQEHHEVVIAGGGMGGLILALCLDAQYNHSPSTSTTTTAAAAPETNENKIEIHVYESASEFSPGAGGAIGLYANGLRVLRDLSNQHPLLTSLLDDVRTAVSTLVLYIILYDYENYTSL